MGVVLFMRREMKVKKGMVEFGVLRFGVLRGNGYESEGEGDWMGVWV